MTGSVMLVGVAIFVTGFCINMDLDGYCTFLLFSTTKQP